MNKTIKVNGVETSFKEVGEGMIAWMEDPGHIFVLEYVVACGLSKEEVEEMGESDEGFGLALKRAYSLQELKLAVGALKGTVDRAVALKALESFHQWKGDARIVNNNVFQRYATEAAVRAKRLGSSVEEVADGEVGSSGSSGQGVDSSGDGADE